MARAAARRSPTIASDIDSGEESRAVELLAPFHKRFASMSTLLTSLPLISRFSIRSATVLDLLRHIHAAFVFSPSLLGIHELQDLSFCRWPDVPVPLRILRPDELAVVVEDHVAVSVSHFESERGSVFEVRQMIARERVSQCVVLSSRLASVRDFMAKIGGLPRPICRPSLWTTPPFNRLRPRRFTNGKGRGRMWN